MFSKKRNTYVACSLLFVISHISISRSVGFQSPNIVRSVHKRTITTSGLFGIKGFRTWLQSEFPHAFTPVEHSYYYFSRNVGSSQRYFDHVLIDVNHIVHVTVRRSYNNTHALQLLTQELDKFIALATPTKSLVLALDGRPCAAKLVTHRQRRSAIRKRSHWLTTKLPILLRSLHKRYGYNLEESPKLKAWKKRLRKDERALCITPDHEFMKSVAETCWKWASQWSSTADTMRSNIHVHVSPSQESGEGEVKLLHWLLFRNADSSSLSRIQPQDTVAFMGGDSDLILLGMAIPVHLTCNIFVIFPPGSTISWIVSLRQILNTIDKQLPASSTPSGIVQKHQQLFRVRLDLIWIFIMNGNDYLPKLRGSPGLDAMFHTYIVVHNKYRGSDKDDDKAYFMHTETPSLNIQFCLAYFSELAQSSSIVTDELTNSTSLTPLSCLQNLVNIGILPGPISFQVMTRSEDTIDAFNDLKLSLGGGDTPQYEFKTCLEKDVSKKKKKQALAQMALDNIFGGDDNLMNQLFLLGNDPPSNMEESWNSADMTRNIPADTQEYIRGLQWNLKMYQEGTCADYDYDYGRRLAPTVYDMLNYFQSWT